MSKNWEPGDLALCVKGGTLVTPAKETPKAGALYTVSGVLTRTFGNIEHSVLALRLKDGPPNNDNKYEWAAHRFVKVTPGEEIEGKEVEKKRELEGIKA